MFNQQVKQNYFNHRSSKNLTNEFRHSHACISSIIVKSIFGGIGGCVGEHDKSGSTSFVQLTTVEAIFIIVSCFLCYCSSRRGQRAAALAYARNHSVGGSNPMGGNVPPPKPTFTSPRWSRFARGVHSEPKRDPDPSPPPRQILPPSSTPVPTEPHDPTNFPQYPPPSFSVV